MFAAGAHATHSAAIMNSKINAIFNKAAWPAASFLQRGPLHRMAWRDVGKRDGEPWLLLHGGPGGSCQPGMLAPFDLSRQRVIAPDQRGAGASRPKGCVSAGNAAALVEDMEALRKHLGLECWSLFAGSWGVVIALLYAQGYPQRVQHMVLRGAFRMSRAELQALLAPSARHGKRMRGADRHWPVAVGQRPSQALARLAQLLQSATPAVAGLHALRNWALRERRDALHGLWRSLLHGDAAHAPAMRRNWAQMHRQQRSALWKLRGSVMRKPDVLLWARYRVQAHYLLHGAAARPARLDRAAKALKSHGNVDWVHGSFDAICAPANSRRWAGMRHGLQHPCCGHLLSEPAMRQAITQCVLQKK